VARFRLHIRFWVAQRFAAIPDLFSEAALAAEVTLHKPKKFDDSLIRYDESS